MTKEKWYENMPVEKLNKALEGTGWTVGMIYRARCLKELDMARDIRDENDKIFKLDYRSPEQEAQIKKVNEMKKNLDKLIQEP